ncbi:hypothetical protein D7V21_12505 [Acinetobacter guerrae]|uniref:Lipoprotein n=1 Tax=Acinetobacter guerrae TaxID=1843371 RepID=A0A3A8EB12_9GAMM|nr:hypothetical protein [Acinetobacter guerrae]RKG32202.1 hypothetical protein D7V21_12505 [Acinetobacter guerrae]
MLKKMASSGVLVLGLAACHAFPTTNSVERVQVAKSLQGKQCEQQGLDISILKQQLQTKHIHVYAESVGHDGMMRPQMCGAPDGKIAIFSIDQKQLAQAQAIGFVIYQVP